MKNAQVQQWTWLLLFVLLAKQSDALPLRQIANAKRQNLELALGPEHSARLQGWSDMPEIVISGPEQGGAPSGFEPVAPSEKPLDIDWAQHLASLNPNPYGMARPQKPEEPSTVIGSLLQAPIPLESIFKDPQAKWSAPMIPSGQFDPMPHLAEKQGEPEAGGLKKEEEKKEPAAEPAKKPEDSQEKPKEAEPAKPEESVKPDPEKLKQITEALAKAESENKKATVEAAAPGTAEPPKPAGEGAPKVRRALHRRAVVPQKTKLVKRKGGGPRSVGPNGIKPAGGMRFPPRKRGMLSEESGEAIGNFEGCPSVQEQQEVYIPVTYVELELIKAGKYKVQRVDAQGRPIEENEEGGEAPKAEKEKRSVLLRREKDTEVTGFIAGRECPKLPELQVLIPVSDAQMEALKAGDLVLEPTGQSGLVVLVPSPNLEGEGEGEGQSEDSEGSEGEGEQSTYDVVPVSPEEELGSSSKIASVVSESGSGKEGEPLKKRATKDFIASMSKRADGFAVLQKRVQGSNGFNSSIFGNGQGKLKYGHKIHFNSASSSRMPSHFATSALTSSSSVSAMLALIFAASLHLLL